jgi:hypothetical protein
MDYVAEICTGFALAAGVYWGTLAVQVILIAFQLPADADEN